MFNPRQPLYYVVNDSLPHGLRKSRNFRDFDYQGQKPTKRERDSLAPFVLQRITEAMKKRQRNQSNKSNVKKIVNIRLRPDQEEKIHALVERSAILDTSKVVRIAVDWLLMSDIGEVLTKIVNPQAFPDYQIPKKPRGGKKRRRRP